MKHIIKISIFLVLMATSCQEGHIEQEVPVTTGEMTFDVLAPGASTKVSDNVFEASDKIGIYVTDYLDANTPMPLQISGNRANNIALSFDGTSWSPESSVYWGGGKSDVYAYYPYIAEMQDVDSQYFEVAADQTGDGYGDSDILWAKAEGVRQTDGDVSLQMRHLMSKLVVKIVAGEDYVGSLPDDASVLLHSTVTGARLDLPRGSVSKDSHSGVNTIKMKKLGFRVSDGVDAVVYEAIVVPQMLESIVPLLEINSKSVSYLLEDSFNFRPGVSYVYTATLNTSTTAIKVDIGCELEDWNSTGGESGEGDGSGEDAPAEGEGDSVVYTDLSTNGTANCYLVQGAGNYKFKSVIGNTDATVGNVKSVEVLWESFGTDEMPNVGDIVSSVSYKDGYVRFSTPENFRDGNAVIAAKNSKGAVIWSWHIWCAAEGWKEQVYYNNAGTMMDRNLGATSATPGDVGALGLIYQWGRKDPFMGASSISSDEVALSTGVWGVLSDGNMNLAETNPMTFYIFLHMPNLSWRPEKTAFDPCPVGWRVPDGGVDGVWFKAFGSTEDFDGGEFLNENARGMNFSGLLGGDETIWYPFAGTRYAGDGAFVDAGSRTFCWSCLSDSFTDPNQYVPYLWINFNGYISPLTVASRGEGMSVRCFKEGSVYL